MNRRDFLQSSTIALGSIWLPGVMRNANTWTQLAQLPTGLGMGVNCGSDPGRDARLALALETLQPAWWYHWRQWPVSATSGYIPMAHPTPNGGNPPYPLSVATVNGLQQALAAVGVDIDTVPWLVSNEPEGGGWPPEQAAAAAAAEVQTLRDAGLRPLIIAPNGNVTTTEHLAYLDAWRNAATRHGLDYTLSIHVYDNDLDRLDMAWQRFAATLDDGEQVLVTECGAGPNRPMAEWLTVMPWFYGLLNDPRVRALAPFAAYPYNTAYYGSYPGTMTLDGDLTELGEQFMEMNNV